ncbi:SPJ_0845 family protein [Vagococcus acidifermentans]|uniref:SPJ_0845 family protein n=1 Tax=Vagococcus acidifermentans TaxID=564710 RepID=UPI00147782E7|nr:SPJ_0845 family protein [Vagococcus acidifermentans]
MGLKFTRKDDLEKLFDQFAIDPDKKAEKELAKDASEARFLTSSEKQADTQKDARTSD